MVLMIANRTLAVWLRTTEFTEENCRKYEVRSNLYWKAQTTETMFGLPVSKHPTA